MATKTKTIQPPAEVQMCNNCHTREAELKESGYAERCVYCSKRFDSTGRVFIIYRTEVEFKSPLGLHYLFHFFEDKCVHAPAGFTQYVSHTITSVIADMEHNKYTLVNIFPPVMK